MSARGRWCAAATVCILALSFAVLLIVGLRFSAMELHLDMDLMYENQPALKALSSVIDSLGLPKLLHTDVAMWDAIWHMGSWALQGEVNSGIAFLMFAVLVALFPIVDVIVLMLATCLALCEGSSTDHAAKRRLLAISRVLRKVGMLDVAVVGVVLVTLSLSQMRGKGVILGVREGTYLLIAAEVCHYLVAWLVAYAFAPPDVAADTPEKGCGPKESNFSEASTDLESNGGSSLGDIDSEGVENDPVRSEVRDREGAAQVEV